VDFETTTARGEICGRDVGRAADVMAALASMPELLERALAAARPAPDGWGPREVAAHLADTEVFRGWRIRRIVAEERPLIDGFDEEVWAIALSYAERNIATSLAAFAANRRANLELLRLAGDAGLRREYRHAQLGLLTLDDLVRHTSDHDLAHLRQLRGG
jgi:nuclear transport factor 2 (NTF2) superfamily protein